MVVFGEVRLAGEVRSVIHTEQRVREAARLGFSRVLLARRDAKLLRARGMEITAGRHVYHPRCGRSGGGVGFTLTKPP
jgi:predicted ATP-dependent serine protease